MVALFCAICGKLNDTVEQKFPHKTIILTTCRNPDCALGKKQATLGPNSMNDPKVLSDWGVTAQYDIHTGKKL